MSLEIFMTMRRTISNGRTGDEQVREIDSVPTRGHQNKLAQRFVTLSEDNFNSLEFWTSILGDKERSMPARLDGQWSACEGLESHYDTVKSNGICIRISSKASRSL